MAPIIKTFYIKNSSWFDSHPYDKGLIADTIKSTGLAVPQTIHFSPSYGWNNQPEVVCFNTDIGNVKEIEKVVGVACCGEGREAWILILEKDW